MAEFGFLGVVVYTRVQTPRRIGHEANAGDLDLYFAGDRPLRINWLTVGIMVSVRARTEIPPPTNWQSLPVREGDYSRPIESGVKPLFSQGTELRGKGMILCGPNRGVKMNFQPESPMVSDWNDQVQNWRPGVHLGWRKPDISRKSMNLDRQKNQFLTSP
jgi:hypothetical protein